MKERIRMVLQILAAAGLLAASCMLIAKYVQYGESVEGWRRSSEKIAETNERSSFDDNAETNEGSSFDDNAEMNERSSSDDNPESDKRMDSANDSKTDKEIRVQILSNRYESEIHDSLALSCESGFTVYCGEREQMFLRNDLPETGSTEDISLRFCKVAGGEIWNADPDTMREEEIFCAVPPDGEAITVESLKRSDGTPEYRGRLYFYREGEGLALINELPLEEYLCGVVSSEMSSDYPMEAQKAQAVCARTYGLNCMKRRKFSNSLADLDDSTEFQVYNSYRSSENSRRAVEETAGEFLMLDEVLYYSTSCLTEHREDLGTEEAFASFLAEEVTEDAEYGSPWLRWETVIAKEQVLGQVRKLYAFTDDTADVHLIVTKRSKSGQVWQLAVKCTGADTSADGSTAEILVDGEYHIRKLLRASQSRILLRDGTEVNGMAMLPSAFFCMEEQEDSFVIRGGGYGHGIGMSQCGAAQMAEEGNDYRTILKYYYDEAEVQGET